MQNTAKCRKLCRVRALAVMMNKNTDNEFLDANQAAKMLHVGKRKLRAWSQEGGPLHPIRPSHVKSPLRYRKTDIERFIDDYTINNT